MRQVMLVSMVEQTHQISLKHPSGWNQFYQRVAVRMKLSINLSNKLFEYGSKSTQNTETRNLSREKLAQFCDFPCEDTCFFVALCYFNNPTLQYLKKMN